MTKNAAQHWGISVRPKKSLLKSTDPKLFFWRESAKNYAKGINMIIGSWMVALHQKP